MSLVRMKSCLGRRPVTPIFSQTRRGCSSLLSQAREKLAALGEGQITLSKDEDEGIAVVTLDHPERKNALSGSMMVQLADVVHDLSSWERGKGVIFRAKGDTFCSGGDLTTVKSIANPEDGLLMSTFMHDTLTRLYTSPLVSVCLVHGKAVGGGAELTTVTDYRIFTEAGEVSFVQGRMGVVTGWGGGTRLVRLLGAGKALDLLTTGKKMNAETALAAGFANEVVPVMLEDDSLEQTRSWLATRLSFDTEVIRATKRIIVGARDLPLDESLLNERLCFSPLWGGPANLRALGGNIKHK